MIIKKEIFQKIKFLSKLFQKSFNFAEFSYDILNISLQLMQLIDRQAMIDALVSAASIIVVTLFQHLVRTSTVSY